MIEKPVPGDVVLTIGAFDGVHRGHRALLDRLTRIASESHAEPVALTFEPHPRCVVDPAGCPPLLTGYAERSVLVERAGARATVLRFTPELSRVEADDFFEALLGSLRIVHVLAGPRFAVGRDRRGDLAFLSAFGARHGFGVTVVPELRIGGGPVSSTRIRSALQRGRVVNAARLLGRRYALEGTVVRGEGRGATLGFPTANLALPAGRCLPSPGIYATRVRVGDAWLGGATSLGVNPTFAGGGLSLETHVMDFEGDLYGQSVEVAFVSRLRAERAFPDGEALARQIAADVTDARRRLERAAVAPAGEAARS